LSRRRSGGSAVFFAPLQRFSRVCSQYSCLYARSATVPRRSLGQVDPGALAEAERLRHADHRVARLRDRVVAAVALPLLVGELVEDGVARLHQ
jgi:hypothetical protein